MSTNPVLVAVAMALGAQPAIAAAWNVVAGGQRETNFVVARFDGEIGHR